MKTISFFFFTALLLLTTCTFLTFARDGSFHDDPKPTKGKPIANKGTGNTNGKGNGNGNGGGGGIGGFFGPGGGFGIPGVGNGNGWGNIGGGYGSGYGGPNGGFGRGGVIRPTVVCKERGPCYKKKLTCPAKCFTSYSRSGKNYGAGGGGGGCTMDCKKKCVAFC